MKVTIDRFEGDFAVVVLSDRSTAEIPRKLVDPSAKEGDILEIRIDESARTERESKIKKLMDDVFEP